MGYGKHRGLSKPSIFVLSEVERVCEVEVEVEVEVLFSSDVPVQIRQKSESPNEINQSVQLFLRFSFLDNNNRSYTAREIQKLASAGSSAMGS